MKNFKLASELLDKFFSSEPEFINSIISQVEAMDFEGPTVPEYFELFEGHYSNIHKSFHVENADDCFFSEISMLYDTISIESTDDSKVTIGGITNIILGKKYIGATPTTTSYSTAA